MRYQAVRDANIHTCESHLNRTLRSGALGRARRVHAAAMQAVARRGPGWAGPSRASFVRAVRNDVAKQVGWFALLWPLMRLLLTHLVPILIDWLDREFATRTFRTDAEKRNALERWAREARNEE